MRLSEAIMLGSTQTRINSCSWDHCLVGMGFHALAGMSARMGMRAEEACARWPWLNTDVFCPKEIAGDQGGGPDEAIYIISNVATLVENGTVTLEAAVDWIRSVEPAEEPVQIPETIQQEELEIA